jgi:hypothetical protein
MNSLSKHKFLAGILCGCLLAAFKVSAATSLPAVSHDGLHLVPDTEMRAVYMKPGADLKEYNKVAIIKCYVAFRKNWQRDHNRDAMSMQNRVSDHEMQEIRERVSKEFHKEFEDVLTKGGHEVVAKPGPGVLILRPSIVNLDVNAPDTMSAGRSRTYGRSSGQMTLYMELLDGVTGDIIARVMDAQAGRQGGFAEYLNRVTNTADADRILRRWAELLDKHLGDARAMSGK